MRKKKVSSRRYLVKFSSSWRRNVRHWHHCERESPSYRYSKVIHRWRGERPCYSPQPPVNNFGGAQEMCCGELSVLLNQQIEHAGSGRRILRPNVATFSQRLSLRHPAPCRKGTLRTLRLQVQTLAETNLYKPFHPAGPRAQSQTINPSLSPR